MPALSNTSSHFLQIVKLSAPGREQPVLFIPRFVADSKLCVATVLDEYADRTSSLRGEEKQLFISYAKPHHGVSRHYFEMDKDCDAKGWWRYLRIKTAQYASSIYKQGS